MSLLPEFLFIAVGIAHADCFKCHMVSLFLFINEFLTIMWKFALIRIEHVTHIISLIVQLEKECLKLRDEFSC